MPTSKVCGASNDYTGRPTCFQPISGCAATSIAGYPFLITLFLIMQSTTLFIFKMNCK